METLVTTGELVSANVIVYGGEPPFTVMPHGWHVSRVPETLALTVKAGVDGKGVVTHSVVWPAKRTIKDQKAKSEITR